MASGEAQAQNDGQPKESGLKRLLSFRKRRKSVSAPVHPVEGEVVPPVPPLPQEKQVKFAHEKASSTKDAPADKRDRNKKTAEGNPKAASIEKNNTPNGDSTTEPQETEAERRLRTMHIPTHSIRDALLLVHPDHHEQDLRMAKSSGRASRPADVRDFNFGSGQQFPYPRREAGRFDRRIYDGDGEQYHSLAQSSTARRSSRSRHKHADEDKKSPENDRTSSSNSDHTSHRQRRKSHSAARGQDASVVYLDDLRRRVSVSPTTASAPATVTKERKRRKSTSSASRPSPHVSALGEKSNVVYVDTNMPPPLPESVPRSRRKSMSSATPDSHAAAKSQTIDSERNSQTSSTPSSKAPSRTAAPEILTIPSILKTSNSQRPTPGEAPVPPVPSIPAELQSSLSRSKSKGMSVGHNLNEERNRCSTNFSRPSILKPPEERRDTVVEYEPLPPAEDTGGIGQPFSFPWDEKPAEPATVRANGIDAGQKACRSSRFKEDVTPLIPELASPRPAIQQHEYKASLVDIMDVPAPAIEYEVVFVRDADDAEEGAYLMSGALGHVHRADMEARDDASSIYEDDDLMAFDERDDEKRIWEDEVF